MSNRSCTPDSLASIRTVVIWGASRSGKDCLKQLLEQGIEVSFFLDQQVPEGGQMGGVEVISTKCITDTQARLLRVDAIILAMGADTSQPRAVLAELGVDKPVLSFREGASMAAILSGQLCIHRLFAYDNGEDDLRCLAVLAEQCKKHAPVLLYGMGKLAAYLLRHFPDLNEAVLVRVDDENADLPALVDIDSAAVNAVFIASTRYLTIEKLTRNVRRYLGEDITLLGVADLRQLMPTDDIPARAWRSPEYSIYPIDIPAIEFEDDLDFILLDLPARFLGMMPNGLGYVHNILKGTGIRFQTMDLDMIFYHRYHSQRVLDGLDEVITPSGYIMQREPWAIDLVTEEWAKPELIDYFQNDIDELITAIILAKPKMIGLSLHNTNLPIARQVVQRLRKALPELIVIAGGYDCIRPEQGPLAFPDFDYMVVFEAESSLPGLVAHLMKGEQPRNMPGIISKYDEQAFPFIPASLVEDLDSIDFPRYEWADINLYRNYNGYQLTPIVLSRGCRWSRCTFCGERFHWRCRTPKNMVDEIEWLAQQGCSVFHFNDSDLSGDPVAVRGVCEEVIRRGLKGLTFVGQLRVQKGYTQDYFHVLKEAGFNSLRYGIDGWSKNTLKLHKKGYTLQMIKDVIRMTHAAGIDVGINLVIGIPYETEADIDETIENIISNKTYISRIENINTLMLFSGSLYWETPGKYNIFFHGNQEELYKQYPQNIPVEHWYSTEPYIDQDIRRQRLKRIVDAVLDAGISFGSFAEKRVETRLNESEVCH